MVYRIIVIVSHLVLFLSCRSTAAEQQRIFLGMDFFNNLTGGDKKKKDGNKNNNPLANAFANLGGGGRKGFKGQGQSLGGSKPGEVIPISLPNPGPLGVQVCSLLPINMLLVDFSNR